MNKESINNDIIFLQKVASFTNIILKEVTSLRSQVSGHMQKQASADRLNDQYKTSVKKVAKALYDSDLDFIAGEFNHHEFIKRASEDPSYLARMFEKVCNAADVSLIGKPARVAPISKKAAYNDPVYAKAFGGSRQAIEDGVIDWDE